MGVGVGVDVKQVQLVLDVQLGWRQYPPEQTKPAWQLEFDPQVPLQLLGAPGVGVGPEVGVGVGLPESAGVGVGSVAGVGVGWEEELMVIVVGLVSPVILAALAP